ncbi:MAG: J domain-containing protein [Phycisphaerae bacterium]|nr:J domain-containing protein [Phycisphaerae bacterium]
MPENDWQDEITLAQERDAKARAILGVSQAADDPEIRQAFRRACTRFHPDAGGGDKDADRKFHLICCAYKFLTEGEPCAALDELEAPPVEMTAGEFQMGNPWGYWCWWRENFFDS